MLEATPLTSPDVTRLQIEGPRVPPTAYVHLESIPNVWGDKSFADDLNRNGVL